MFDAIVQTVIDQVDRLRDQVDDHWQIPRDEALLLAQLVRIGRCRSICEIGASYGFSTLHLAAASRCTGGHVHSIDIEPRKVQAAQKHLAMAGLSDQVTLHTGDARQVLQQLQPREPFDLVFIDAVKDQCFDYLQVVWPKLASHAVILTDNTLTHADELASFIAHLRQHPELRSCGVPVGNGLEVSVRVSGSGRG